MDTRRLGEYEHQFRVLVMNFVMDDLSLEQIDRYFFVYKPPERLKDHGRERLRSELLAYINEQLLDGWRKTPRDLQKVLETLGRSDLSTQVQELVERYPATTVCQETSSEAGCSFSPQQESVQGGKQQPSPVEETQHSTQTQQQLQREFAQDELHRDFCAGKDRSSTNGEATQREAQPQAVSNHSTLPSSTRYSMSRKNSKQRRERQLENIQEEMSPSLDGKKRNSGTGSLKRTASTASTVSHDSAYYSNPRTSVLRLSTADSFTDSFTENADDDQEGASAFLGPIKQAHEDSVEDEGVVMSIQQASNFCIDSRESSSTDSSSPPSSPSKIDETALLSAADEDDLKPILRGRCNQMTVTPSRKRRMLPKQNDVLCSDFSLEQGDMRRRSSSLPSRTSYVQAQNAAVRMPGLQSPVSHSSSTSLDSETTYGSPSEQSSMNGSQLSLASATSGHDSKSNSLSRHMSPPNQKPLPVDSGITLTGSMKIKVKEVVKLIDKNSQHPVLSGEFPSFKGHRGPRYEMRFFPSTFSKEKKCSALYIDVARSYLNKKSKRKEQQHRMVEIPAMNITVQLSYDGVGGGSIKTETLETAVKTIDSCGDASGRLPVASFPKLVSHAELGLSEALTEGRSSLVITVDMSVRSS